MKFLFALLAICLSLAYVAAQDQRFLLGQLPAARRVPRQFNFNYPAQASARDPRQNRGPVVFPPSPPDAIDESSGVIVGASGYGFVPPQQRGQFYYLTTLDAPPVAAYTAYDYFSSPFVHRFNYF